MIERTTKDGRKVLINVTRVYAETNNDCTGCMTRMKANGKVIQAVKFPWITIAVAKVVGEYDYAVGISFRAEGENQGKAYGASKAAGRAMKALYNNSDENPAKKRTHPDATWRLRLLNPEEVFGWAVECGMIQINRWGNQAIQGATFVPSARVTGSIIVSDLTKGLREKFQKVESRLYSAAQTVG